MILSINFAILTFFMIFVQFSENILGSVGMKIFTQVKIKMHYPCLLPLFKFLKVLLQGLGIIFAGDGQIYGSVISKNLTCQNVSLVFRSTSTMS